MKFDRIYHPVTLWEELKFNMYGEVTDKKKYLQMAIEFTSNHEKYGTYMLQVITLWKYSCENALTDTRINRKAWVGHAACALAMQCPEDIVREAWGHLTDEQRILANREAQRAIDVWESNYAKSIGICEDMEVQVLF